MNLRSRSYIVEAPSVRKFGEGFPQNLMKHDPPDHMDMYELEKLAKDKNLSVADMVRLQEYIKKVLDSSPMNTWGHWDLKMALSNLNLKIMQKREGIDRRKLSTIHGRQARKSAPKELVDMVNHLENSVYDDLTRMANYKIKLDKELYHTGKVSSRKEYDIVVTLGSIKMNMKENYGFDRGIDGILHDPKIELSIGDIIRLKNAFNIDRSARAVYDRLKKQKNLFWEMKGGGRGENGLHVNYSGEP